MLTEISLSIPASDLSPAERAQLLVPTLSALSDENRLTILLTLAEKSMTNRQLHEVTGMSQALVSHHLAALRKAGLFAVWTPDELVARKHMVAERGAFGFQPLLGGLAPEEGWKSLELLKKVMPELKA